MHLFLPIVLLLHDQKVESLDLRIFCHFSLYAAHELLDVDVVCVTIVILLHHAHQLVVLIVALHVDHLVIDPVFSQLLLWHIASASEA